MKKLLSFLIFLAILFVVLFYFAGLEERDEKAPLQDPLPEEDSEEVRETKLLGIPLEGIFQGEPLSVLVNVPLPQGVDETTLEKIVVDTDEDGTSELFLTVLEPLENSKWTWGERARAHLILVKILNKEGEVSVAGELSYENTFGDAVKILEVADLNGTGSKEIVISQEILGANVWSEIGVLTSDPFSWAEVISQEGESERPLFIRRGGAAYLFWAEIEDINGDGTREIVKFDARIDHTVSVTECSISVYAWQEHSFVYHQELSEEKTSQAGEQCGLDDVFF